uniref:Na_H_Exchanger domain-containing protein n=1 Tax=Heligmosomoides polygyrus TaxID=6339 RepID=A0A183FYG5_HELPZ
LRVNNSVKVIITFSLCVGIFIANVPHLAELVYLNEYWHYIIRKLCLVCIIVRWGLGINGTYIRENPIYPFALGVLSTIAEAGVIAIVSVVFFHIPIEFGVIGGFLLATVSPAVCGPVMLKLQRLNLGTDKHIPSFVPAACCFDNTFSIVTVTLVSAITFTRGGHNYRVNQNNVGKTFFRHNYKTTNNLRKRRLNYSNTNIRVRHVQVVSK